MKILVDTDFLIALIKIDDKNHLKAIDKVQKIKEAKVFITPFTIPEAVTVLSYKVSYTAAKNFLKVARNKLSELTLNEEIIVSSDKIFLSQNKKGKSWIDCLNVALIKYYKLDGILSFDKFYLKLGVNVF